jgi:hypothetical protein
MSDQGLKKWFWLGFALTGVVLLALAAVFAAPRVLAQGGEGELPEGSPFSNRAALEASVAGPDSDDTLSGEALLLEEAAYSSPLVIPAADFTSDGTFPSGYRFDATLGYLRGTGVLGTCLMSPVYLPHGATVQEVNASVYDNDSNARIIVTVYRVNNTTAQVNEVAAMSTSIVSAMNQVRVIGTTSINHAVISYPQYSYYVATCLDTAAIRLYSVQIHYAAP